MLLFAVSYVCVLTGVPSCNVQNLLRRHDGRVSSILSVLVLYWYAILYCNFGIFMRELLIDWLRGTPAPPFKLRGVEERSARAGRCFQFGRDFGYLCLSVAPSTLQWIDWGARRILNFKITFWKIGSVWVKNIIDNRPMIVILIQTFGPVQILDSKWNVHSGERLKWDGGSFGSRYSSAAWNTTSGLRVLLMQHWDFFTILLSNIARQKMMVMFLLHTRTLEEEEMNEFWKGDRSHLVDWIDCLRGIIRFKIIQCRWCRNGTSYTSVVLHNIITIHLNAFGTYWAWARARACFASDWR